MGSKFLDATGLAYLWGKIKSYVGTTIDDKAADHKNLLDNWYFAGGGSQSGAGKFPINQRGETSYSGAGYSIDRWRSTNANLSVTINSDSITLTAGSANAFFRQFLPRSYEGTYTLSAYIRGSGSGYLAFTKGDSSYTILESVTFSNPGNNWTLISCTFTTSADPIERMVFRTNSGESIDVKAVKMEAGSISTLANDAPPNYVEEYIKCVTAAIDSSDTYANKDIALIDAASGNGLINALSAGTSGVANTESAYLITQYSDGSKDTYYRRLASNVRVGGLTTARSLKVALGSTTAVTFDGTADQNSIPVSGTLAVARGGTGATTFTSGAALIGAGTGAVTTKAITDNSSSTALSSSSTNLTTERTAFYGVANFCNRANKVSSANTSYTTVMARGISLQSTGVYINTNGVVTLVYE